MGPGAATGAGTATAGGPGNACPGHTHIQVRRYSLNQMVWLRCPLPLTSRYWHHGHWLAQMLPWALPPVLAQMLRAALPVWAAHALQARLWSGELCSLHTAPEQETLGTSLAR
jgi:hypothetical protein